MLASKIRTVDDETVNNIIVFRFNLKLRFIHPAPIYAVKVMIACSFDHLI